MQKLASIATAFAVAAAVVPGAASAKPVTRHHNPIAHIAVAAHGKTAHKQAGPR
jgi:hypothetical protein